MIILFSLILGSIGLFVWSPTAAVLSIAISIWIATYFHPVATPIIMDFGIIVDNENFSTIAKSIDSWQHHGLILLFISHIVSICISILMFKPRKARDAGYREIENGLKSHNSVENLNYDIMTICSDCRSIINAEARSCSFCDAPDPFKAKTVLSYGHDFKRKIDNYGTSSLFIWNFWGFNTSFLILLIALVQPNYLLKFPSYLIEAFYMLLIIVFLHMLILRFRAGYGNESQSKLFISLRSILRLMKNGYSKLSYTQEESKKASAINIMYHEEVIDYLFADICYSVHENKKGIIREVSSYQKMGFFTLLSYIVISLIITTMAWISYSIMDSGELAISLVTAGLIAGCYFQYDIISRFHTSLSIFCREYLEFSEKLKNTQ